MYHSANKETRLEQMKVYRSENKEKMTEYYKEYRSENKEKIEAKAAVKITCECGCIVRKGNISTHKRSQKHINLMSQIEQSL